MSEEILINVTPAETRVALVENGVLQEIYVERSATLGMVGNIYQGKVVRVLPGMQAAFVDIGLQRASFIHANDLSVGQAWRDQQLESTVPSSGSSEPNIRDLVRDGQTLMVQIVKDPIGTKGARVTSQLSLSSRFLVFMSENDHIGVSQRIEDEEERQRLRELVATLRANDTMAMPGGYIVRTAAEGVGPEELRADMIFLRKLWEALQQRMQAVAVQAKYTGTCRCRCAPFATWCGRR